MARCLPKDHLSYKTPGSPGSPVGFWPNPEKECFYRVQTPPWVVPRRKKPKGDSQEFFYDFYDEELIWKYSGEVTTSNRFDVLSQEDLHFSTCKEELQGPSKKNKPKFSSKQASDFSSNFYFDMCETSDTRNSVYNNHVGSFITRNSVKHNSFKDFMLDKNKLTDNNSHHMYSNKYNFCSGYSPDFITLDSIDGFNYSKGSDMSHYYLYVNNNMYVKPLSNPVSKYDNGYFDKMRHAYEISRVQGWWNTEIGNPIIPEESEIGFIDISVDINKSDACVSKDSDKGIPGVVLENKVVRAVPKNSEKVIHRNSEKGIPKGSEIGTHGTVNVGVGGSDTHTHTHTHTDTHTQTGTWTHTHTHTNTHIHIHTHTNIHTHIQTHMDRQTHIHRYIHIH